MTPGKNEPRTAVGAGRGSEVISEQQDDEAHDSTTPVSGNVYRVRADGFRENAADARLDGDEGHASWCEFEAAVADSCAHLADLGQPVDEAAVRKAQGAISGSPRTPRDAEVLTATAESWVPVDLGPALRGEAKPAVPTVLRREDGRSLLYAACINGVHGDSGSGKGWLSAIAAAQELNAGRHVVWVDFEDSPVVIAERLHKVLRVPADVIVWQLHYFRPVEPFDAEAVEAVASIVRLNRVSLVVIDSLGEAFGLEGIDEDKDAQVGPWLRRVARTIADLGPAVLLIDHSTKAKDNALFPSGSKRKRAAITGAAYFLEAPKPLTREHGGRLRLTCAKDRHGHYRRGEPAAVVDFHVYPDGGPSVKVWPPSIGEPERADDDRVAKLALDMVAVVKGSGRPMSGREITESPAIKSVKARADLKRAALDHAVGVGAFTTATGPRRAIVHSYVPGGEALISSASECVPSSSDTLSTDRDLSVSSASRSIGRTHSDTVAVAGDEQEPYEHRDALNAAEVVA